MKNTFVSILVLGSTLLAGNAANAGFDFNPSSDHEGDAAVSMDNGGCCDRLVTEVVCHDTNGYRDAGLSITIQSGGFAGLTTATVSEMTIAGPVAVSTMIVSRSDSARHPGLIAYSGEKFRLLINTSEVKEGFSPASVKTKIKGRTVTEEMVCRVR